MRVKRTAKLKRNHGEAFLSKCKEITIRLDNGEEVEFNVADELRIPSDPDLLLQAARKAPARVAFWAYQAERALGAVRKLEIRLAQVEGEYDLKYRGAIDDSPLVLTEKVVKAHLDLDTSVRRVRVSLNRVRMQKGLIFAIAGAVEHRCYVLRKLVAQPAYDAT